MKYLKYYLLSLLVTCFVQVPEASAELLFYTCDIKAIGAKVEGKNRRAILTLDDYGGAFTDQSFLLHPKTYRSMLATSLAAATSKLQIEIRVDLTKSPARPVISQLLLLP